MGVVIRQSILTSIISYAGVVIGYINLLYLYPRFLHLEQIGLLRTIQDVAMLMAPFAQMGLAQSVVRFYPQFSKDNHQGTGFINFVLLLSVAGYGIFLLVFVLLKNNITAFFGENAAVVTNYISLILWMTFFLTVLAILEFYSRSLMKIALPNFLREIVIRVLQGALVSIYFLNVITFDQFLMLSVGVYLLTLLLLIGFLVIQNHLKFHFSFNINAAKTKEIITYSLLSLVGAASMIIIGKVDSIMVTAKAGYAANAIYTTAFYMATVIEIPRRAITQSAATLISKGFERNDLADIQSIYTKTALNQFIIGALLLIGVWANIENVFAIMPKGDVFQNGMYVVLLVGIGKLIDMAFGPNGEIIVFSKYYWFNMITVGVLALVGIVTNYFFIPIYGITGAAYATVLALLIFNVVKWIFVYAKLDMQPFDGSFIKVVLIIAVVVVMNYVLPKVPNVFIDIFYRSSLITLVYGGLILITRSSDEINKLFNTLVTRLKTLK